MNAAEPAALTQQLLAAGAEDITTRADGAIGCRLPRWEVPALADRLGALGLSLELLAATDTRPERGDFTLTYLFAASAPRHPVIAQVSVPADAPRFPSLATRSFA